jgi:hypothetical protein
MIFIIGSFLILLLMYYYYNSSTKKEGLVNSKKIIPSKKFIPSNKFNGAKQGYIFKNCSEGLGYYKDKYQIK